MFYDELQMILELSWNYDTCSPELKSVYDNSNPSLGQCAVTALIVNDCFGGKIMRTMTSTGSHYYNMVGGAIIDMTSNQFNSEIINYKNGEERTREYLLTNDDTRNRYLLLSERVKNYFNEYYEKENIKCKIKKDF